LPRLRLSRLVAAEFARSLGIPGVAGVVLLAAAAIFWLAGLAPAQHDLDRTAAELDQLRERSRRVEAGLEKKQETPADQLKSFYALFPTERQASESLQKIYQAAEKNQIVLPRGEYALTVDAKSNLAKYRITLPLRGTYEQIRGFIAAALEAVPTVSLDEIAFQRQKVGETNLEAKVRMTLFLSRQ
jgi:hypothetical protein